VKPIGSGNFATIWLSKLPATGELMATKVFHLDKLTEGLMLWRFRRSALAMIRLNEDKSASKHVVKIHEIDESTLAFSMEYLSEGNLEDIATRGWTLEKKVEVMIALCSAVDYAHRTGVIHRDIKPGNVVLNKHREAILTDFDVSDIKFVTRLSVSGGGLGTPVFAAPEQLEDSAAADERSDVYSLGRLLYFLLLERSPGYEIERDPSLVGLSKYPRALASIVRRASLVRHIDATFPTSAISPG
jgi:serine/threonine protein kinase